MDPEMATARADTLIAVLWQTLKQKAQQSWAWIQTRGGGVCCFKPLSLGIIYYAAIHMVWYVVFTSFLFLSHGSSNFGTFYHYKFLSLY